MQEEQNNEQFRGPTVNEMKLTNATVLVSVKHFDKVYSEFLRNIARAVQVIT